MDHLDVFERVIKIFLDKDGNINIRNVTLVIIVLIIISSIFLIIPIIHGKYLPAPNQPELISPIEEQKDVEVLPTYSWKGGNDESQISLLLSQININMTNLLSLDPVIEYSIYVSDNKTEIEANCLGSCQGNESSLPVYCPIKQKLGANTTYYWKVVADNNNRFNKCISESPIRTFKTKPEPIINFSSDRLEIVPGEEVHLSWNVTNVDQVCLYEKPEFSEGFKAYYDPKHEKIVAPTNSTEYILNALNAAGDLNKTISIFVKKIIPIIYYFGALNRSTGNYGDNVTYIKIGENVTLEWKVLNADSVWLVPGRFEPFNLKDYQEVAPLKNSTYTLFAQNKNKIVPRSVEVNIIGS
ncbi:MAG: hypothetical protein WCP70_00985 [Methanothrix sp.]